MAIETNTIKVASGTPIDDLLDAADNGSVRIEREGVVYLLQRETLNMSDEWDEERAERARKALRETAGAWSGDEMKEFIADFYRRREESSHSADQR
jgi:hypothetical protein